MADGDQATPTPNPAGTDAGTTPAAATPPAGGAGATNDNSQVPEGMRLISEQDYKNLQSARDRANNAAAANQDFVNELAKERTLDSFLSDNQEKFPDVKREDLMHLEDPEQVEAEADRIQKRLSAHAKEVVKNVQKVGPTTISPKDKAEQLKAIKANPGKDGFERAVKLQMTPTA
jgi:uncharacterized protein with WD repeat